MSEIERKIHNEQIRLIYNHATLLASSSTVCAVVLTSFLWRQLPQSLLLYWMVVVVAVSAIRLWCVYAYLKADQLSRERTVWGTIMWLGALISGIIWGAWPLLFYQHYADDYLLLISAIFAAMVSVSASSGSVYLPSFIAFAIPLVLPLSIAHLLSGRDPLQIVGILLILFLAVNFVLVVRSNRQNRDLLYSKLENQKLIERLAEEKLLAERAMAAKSRFLAAASHDLRQPLHAMGLFLSALQNRENDVQNKRIIEDMCKSADALNSLFNSLLDVSRLDAEIIEFKPVHVPAGQLFDTLRAQFAQQALQKGISLRIRANDEVLYCDVVLLERVLRNLFSNALRYTNKGSVSLICEAQDDSSKLIILKDTGIGIPEEFAEDVFSEYYQLNNPARDRAKGLGLGLAIVRRLCDLMGVTLTMSSIVGEGTEFRVVVPSGNNDKIEKSKAPVERLVAQGCQVLVIDDELQVLQSMRHMLEGWGCDVLLAESARDALKAMALDDSVPDVIISDYRLANDLNGVDAVAAVLESVDLEIPVIIVTGDTSPERLKEVKGTGYELLHKPVLPDDLLDILQMLLRNNNRAQATFNVPIRQSGASPAVK